MQHDMVNHPPHYNSHPSGVEVIELTQYCICCISNALRYTCRAGLKWDSAEDLRKAIWYVNREIALRLTNGAAEVLLPLGRAEQINQLFARYIEMEPDATTRQVVRLLWIAQNSPDSVVELNVALRLLAEKVAAR